MKFTPVEESIILTCIANGIPLCCSPEVADIIPNSAPLREALREFAYEALGCSRDIADHPDMWERYLEKTVAFLCEERLHGNSRDLAYRHR